MLNIYICSFHSKGRVKEKKYIRATKTFESDHKIYLDYKT